MPFEFPSWRIINFLPRSQSIVLIKQIKFTFPSASPSPSPGKHCVSSRQEAPRSSILNFSRVSLSQIINHLAANRTERNQSIDNPSKLILSCRRLCNRFPQRSFVKRQCSSHYRLSWTVKEPSQGCCLARETKMSGDSDDRLPLVPAFTCSVDLKGIDAGEGSDRRRACPTRVRTSEKRKRSHQSN